MALIFLAAMPLEFASAADPVPVFINEIHYDNAGTDINEAIEIAGPAGTTFLVGQLSNITEMVVPLMVLSRWRGPYLIRITGMARLLSTLQVFKMGTRMVLPS